MIENDFSVGKLFEKINNRPSFKFRDKDKLVHHASEASKCHRQVTYKKLGYESSNPPDSYGTFKMSFGNWIERGMNYDVFGKSSLFGVHDLGGQNEIGEHDTFYGTSWHGYRDRDILLKDGDSHKFVIVELKSKMGGAEYMIKETPWGSKFKVPDPDIDWGHLQQLSLYLRDAYQKTVNNSKFKFPIVDGILTYAVFSANSRIAGFVDFLCEYIPETDSVKCYKCVSHQYPECNGEKNITIKLEDIAKRFQYQDKYIKEGKLAPPEFERRYALDDRRVKLDTKTNLKKAIAGNTLIGDVYCKYCPFRDKCAEDLNISLDYTAQEIKQLKSILNSK